jgi:hypothetical protein
MIVTPIETVEWKAQVSTEMLHKHAVAVTLFASLLVVKVNHMDITGKISIATAKL